MKHYSVTIMYKRIKQIPKAVVCFWIILVVICLYCIMQLLPTYRSLDDLQACVIDVEKVYLRDSHDTRGSRMKLEIVSGNITYYVWYPQTKYIDFAYAVENQLLTGNVTSLEAKIVASQSFRDRLLHQKRVVDLRSDSSVYYDLDTEKISIQQHYNSLWLLLVIVIIFLLFYTLFICLLYRVLTFQKK